MEKKIYIVMELCENGQLFEYLKVEGAMIEEMAGKLFIQIYSAIKYLHSQGIAHRDIKAENILLDRKMNAKLIDFGFAKAYDVQSSMLQTFCGSPSYAAPEIVKKSKYNAELVDVWSLGVTLYAMLEASLPFDTYNEKMLETNIMSFKWHIPEYCSEEAMDLFRKIFVPAEARINLQGIKSTNFYLKHTK